MLSADVFRVPSFHFRDFPRQPKWLTHSSNQTMHAQNSFEITLNTGQRSLQIKNYTLLKSLHTHKSANQRYPMPFYRICTYTDLPFRNILDLNPSRQRVSSVLFCLLSHYIRTSLISTMMILHRSALLLLAVAHTVQGGYYANRYDDDAANDDQQQEVAGNSSAAESDNYQDDWVASNQNVDDDMFHWSDQVGFDGVSIMPVSCVN